MAPRVATATGIPTATYNPLVVLVKDGQGRPAAGVTVTWTINKPGAMACQIEPSGASPSTVQTDANGVATLNKMGGRSASIYYADGQCVVTATVGGSSVAFHLNAVPPTANPNTNTLTIVAGDRQTVARGGNQVPGGIATFGPLTVQLRNAAGQPVPNQRVNFSCGAGKPAAMACQLEPAGASSTFGMTDANGMVTAKQMGGNSANAYYASGVMPITVTADLAAPVTFALAVLDAPPPPPPTAGATMQLLNGDNQTAPRLPAATGIPTATYNPLVVDRKSTRLNSSH